MTWLLPALGLVGVCCSTYDRDGEEAMKRCRALLSDPDCDRAVRYGDIYGLMAEHYARRQQWKAVSDQGPIYKLANELS